MDKFKGIFAALVTPYTESDEVNYTEVKHLVRHLINKGIDGFYVCGSSAEAFMLSLEERRKILEAVAEENNGEKTVIAHVGSIGTKLSVELARHAESCGADAISSVAPFYYKFDQEEILSYYRELADSTELPLFLYNFPKQAGFSLTGDLLKKLAGLPHVAGIKHTSSDFYQLERIKSFAPELIVWNGYDEMLLSGLVAGADGGIGSTYNCFPEVYLEIRKRFRAGDIHGAAQCQHLANDVISEMIRCGVYQSAKALLEMEGLSFNGCRRPFKSIRPEQIERLRNVYNKSKKALLEL